MTRLDVMRRSFPTVRLIVAPFRWIGQSRRRIWCAGLLLSAIVASGPLWWATQLWGLPDIGDPFDIKAFRAAHIADDRNAFVLYERAAAQLKLSAKYFAKSKGKVDLSARWPQAHPDVRRWLEDNRETLAVYHQGAERPDALDRDIGLDQSQVRGFAALWGVRQLVLLEASRLEAQGDMAGTWGGYRAVLRTMHHVGMHGDAYRRRIILQWHPELRARLAMWAADRRTTPALLHQAIRDVVACEALAPSESDSIKFGYLEVIKLLQSDDNPGRHMPFARFRSVWNPAFQLTPEQIQSLWDWWRFCRREPERSRRVIGLVTANWLAFQALPIGKRPKPDPTIALEFYRFGPEAPAAARALSPEDLDAWIDTTNDMQQLLQFLDASGVRVLEVENHADILLMLATELYRRDHRNDPPTPQSLVGPYLERLPATVDQVSDQRSAETP